MSFAVPGSPASEAAATAIKRAVYASTYLVFGGSGVWVAPVPLSMWFEAHDGRECTSVVLGQRGCPESERAAEARRRVGGCVVARASGGDDAARMRAWLRVPTLPVVFIRKGAGLPWTYVGGWSDWQASIERS